MWNRIRLESVGKTATIDGIKETLIELENDGLKSASYPIIGNMPRRL